MPIYEYRCRACAHQFEVVQRMSDSPVAECEVCGGAVARVLFAPAIHFKGTGFHNTDYGTRKRSKDGEVAGVDGGGSGGDGGASGEGGGASSNGASAGGDGKAVKEATPKDTAARATGP